MDKLQWFKFTPSDWMMGKIMRCSEVTQARFIRICCLYWNNECELSYEDAELELEKEHLDILVKRKIVNSDGEFINIGFLDIQHAEILELSSDKSKSGVIGNLKRWHPEIYKRFTSKELSLDDALSIAKGSHTDSTPIAPQSQNIADKRREDETRTDENRIDKEDTRKEVLLCSLSEKDEPTLEYFDKVAWSFWKLFKTIKTEEGLASSNLDKAKLSLWSKDARLMVETDKRTKEQMEIVWKHVKNDVEFWRTTVSSISGVRKNFETIFMAAKKSPQGGTTQDEWETYYEEVKARMNGTGTL